MEQPRLSQPKNLLQRVEQGAAWATAAAAGAAAAAAAAAARAAAATGAFLALQCTLLMASMACAPLQPSVMACLGCMR